VRCININHKPDTYVVTKILMTTNTEILEKLMNLILAKSIKLTNMVSV